MTSPGFLRPCLVPCNSWRGNLKQKWNGIAVGADGNLYCAPQHADSLLAIRPEVREVTNIGLPFLFCKVQLDGIAAALDGKLYFTPIMNFSEVDEFGERKFIDGPGQRACVLSFDPVHGTFSHFVQKLDLEGVKAVESNSCLEYGLFCGIAAAGNGKLYCPPSNAAGVAVIDPIKSTVSFIQGAGRGSQRNRWAGIALAADGRLYCAPARARSVLVITPDNDELHFMNDEDLFDECGAARYWQQDENGDWEAVHDAEAGDIHCWSGIAAARNGKLYCAPQDGDAVLVIDPAAWRLSYIKLNTQSPACMSLQFMKNKWAGIVEAADGRLYCAPWCVDCVLVIDPRYATTSFIPVSCWDIVAEHDVCGSFRCDPSHQHEPNSCNFQWCGIAAAGGRIWCAPDSAEDVLSLIVPKEDLTSVLRLGCCLDFVVATEFGEKVDCHRSVVASTSRVFRSMVESGFREGQEHKVCLKDVSHETVKQLVEYIYSGTLPREANVRELVGLAHQFELDHLLAECVEVLVSDINRDNVVDVAHLLKLHSGASFEAARMWRTFQNTLRKDAVLFNACMEGFC